MVHKFPLMLHNWNWINLQCFLRYFLSPFLGSIFHETGVCMIYKDTWYLNNLRRFFSSTPISSNFLEGTCVALRWNSTGGPLVCNQTARGPAQWETQPFETNCWLASDVFFFHHQTFLGGKAFGYKEMWTKGHESLIISEKKHNKNTAWQRSHFIVLVPDFRWMNFLGIFLAILPGQTNSLQKPPLPFGAAEDFFRLQALGFLVEVEQLDIFELQLRRRESCGDFEATLESFLGWTCYTPKFGS